MYGVFLISFIISNLLLHCGPRIYSLYGTGFFFQIVKAYLWPSMESVFINNTFILEKIYIFLIVGIRVPYKSLRSSLLIMLFKITYILSEFLNSWFHTYWAVLPLLWWTYFILGRSVRFFFFFLVFWGNVIFVQTSWKRVNWTFVSLFVFNNAVLP